MFTIQGLLWYSPYQRSFHGDSSRSHCTLCVVSSCILLRFPLVPQGLPNGSEKRTKHCTRTSNPRAITCLEPLSTCQYRRSCQCFLGSNLL